MLFLFESFGTKLFERCMWGLLKRISLYMFPLASAL